MKTKQQKQAILNLLAENVGKQNAMVLVDFKGLKVADMTNLRNQLKEADSRFMVTKKTLLSKAMKAKGIDINVKNMEGQTGTIFAFGDPVSSMKATNIFAKTHENLKILGGYFEGEIQNAVRIVTIASLPSREELLAKLVCTMAAPISDFARVLQGNIKGLITVLAQKAKT